MRKNTTIKSKAGFFSPRYSCFTKEERKLVKNDFEAETRTAQSRFGYILVEEAEQ